MSTAAASQVAQTISYQDLYARWERSHWLATEIDFSQDRIDWQEKMTPQERKAALWFFSLFFHGEDEVTDDLSPYVEAAPLEEQTYFLTTQQVDEARHSIFFNRFMHEVVGLGDGSPGSGLEATRPYLTWGHRKTFENLGAVARRLRDDPSRENFAFAITNYHIIVEGTMAQPGQHLMEAWLERSGLMPGFLEGLRNVAIDEQRHIAFGMKTLADMYSEDPDLIGDVVTEAIKTTGTYLMAFAYPNDGDSSYLDPIGFNLLQLYSDSFRSLGNRLKGIGFDEARRARALTLNPNDSFEEQGRKVLALLDAGYVGEPKANRSKRPEDVELVFDMLQNIITPNLPPEGTVIQFDLTDLGPRHYISRQGLLEYHAARHPDPTVDVRISFDDLLDLVGERVNPIKLLLTRRLRIGGDRGLLVGRRSIFGEPPRSSARRTPILERLGVV